MGAEMEKSVDTLDFTQREVERCVGVPRRAARVVIALLAVATRSAVGLQQHDDVAGAQARETEPVALAGRIGLRWAPRIFNRQGHLRGKGREPRAVALERYGDGVSAGFISETRNDLAGRPIGRAGRIAGPGEHRNDLAHTFGRIETAGIAGAASARGIVRQHDRNAAMFARRRREPRPVGGELRDKGHAIKRRLVHDIAVLQVRIGRCRQT